MNTLEAWELEPVVTWGEIRGKAHHYKTARVRATGEYVALVSILYTRNGLQLSEPIFVCRIAFSETIVELTTGELFNFVL